MTKSPLDAAIAAFLARLTSQGRRPATVAAYRTDLRDLARWLEGEGIPDWGAVDQATLTAYLGQLQAAGRRPTTLRRRVASIKAFFNDRQLHTAPAANPALLLQGPRVTPAGGPPPLTVTESDALLRALAQTGPARSRDRALGALMVATGARVSEVRALNWGQVDLALGLVELTGPLVRLVPLDDRAQAALTTLAGAAGSPGSGAVFMSQRGHRLTRQAIWQLLRQAGQVAGIVGTVTPQRIRDGFAVRLLKHGADLPLLQTLLGLQGLAATQVYLDKLMEGVRDAD